MSPTTSRAPQASVLAKPAPARPTASRASVLQRRCACGSQGALFGGSCTDCNKKRRPLQTKLRVGRADDALEREADQTAERVLRGEPQGAITRASLSVQRDGPGTDTPPKPPAQEGEQAKPEDPASGAANGATATAPAPVCDPKGMTRANFLKEPGTSTKDFGLTSLAATSSIAPSVVTKPVKGGVQVLPTSTALPTIPSVYTGVDTFFEGEAHFIGGEGRSMCPSGKLPIRWTITAKGADKIREGEQDHCSDFQLAFDLSLKRYADAVNAVAGKRTFKNQAAAEKALTKSTGVAPSDWFDKFACLSRKTLVRDKMGWHTPRATTREPRLDTDCKFVYAYVTDTSLPEVGQTKHPSSDIIKDCGEAGVKPAGAAAKVDAADLADAGWDAWGPGEDEAALMQRRERSPEDTGSFDEPPATGLVEQVLGSPGQALDADTRAFMEPRFGRDFGDVRIHLGDQAARSAESVNALAYTVDHHVVFGHGSYNPAGQAGRELLAHELTHVVQQTGSGGRAGTGTMLSRKPKPPLWGRRTDFRRDHGIVEAEDLTDPDFIAWLGSLSRADLRGYKSVVADPAVIAYIDRLLVPDPVSTVANGWLETNDITATLSGNYWEHLVWSTFTTTLGDNGRLAKSAEERDAVYAALWKTKPNSPITSASSVQTEVPPNAVRKSALLYRFDFAPKPPAAKTEGKLTITFVAERTGEIAGPAATPPSKFKEGTLSFDTEIGFDRGAGPYWKSYPEEKRQVAYALHQAGHGMLDLFLRTRSASTTGGRPHEATMRLQGWKDGQSGITAGLSIELITEGRLPQTTLPRDYRQHDMGDIYLREAQTTASPKGDKLGFVNLDGVPDDEKAAVKYYIAQLFRQPHRRDAEANAIIPIPKTQRRVFYKIFFRNDNEADVQRIGVEGANPKLDPNALDVARVEGFDAHSSTPEALKGWLGKRYLELKPTGNTVAEVQQSANQALQAGVTTTDWFAKQYKVFPLTGGKLATRMKSVHSKTNKAVAGTKDFTTDELKLVELSMQTLSDPLLTQLRQLRLGRQTTALKADGTTDAETLPDGSTAGYGGMTYQNGSDRTIVYFDGPSLSGTTRLDFRGDANRVNREETNLMLHEFGHVFEKTATARDAYNAFVKKEGIPAFTPYAGRHLATESFAEAFAIYQQNPSWMLQAYPRLHQWFTALATSGKVPTKLP